jgi:hypothetical protein
MSAAPVPTSAAGIRGRLVDTLRRDLIGPGPEDGDLARELLKNNPSRWYLAGFLALAMFEVLEYFGNNKSTGITIHLDQELIA